MQQDKGQSSSKRRPKLNTSDQEPLTLSYPKERGKSPSAPSSRVTDMHPVDDRAFDSPRANSSVVRYNTHEDTPDTTSSLGAMPQVPPRRQQATRNLPPQQRQQPRITASQRLGGAHEAKALRDHKSVHWLLPLGVGMVAMLVLWMVSSTALAWGIQRYNDFRYGVPRTFQTNAVVGHNGDSPAHPSHFIAMNLNRQAIVVEFMAGDPAKSVSYVAPFEIVGSGSDLAPVTVELKDVNGDGKPDMIMHIQLSTQDQLAFFINDGTKFRPANSNDKIRL